MDVRAGSTVTDVAARFGVSRQADTTFRVYHGAKLLTEALRTTTQQIARFKARKAEPARRPKPTV